MSETLKDRLEREAKLGGRRGARARKRLTEARRSDAHSIPDVPVEPRTPLRPDGRKLGDGLHRALRIFGS